MLIPDPNTIDTLFYKHDNNAKWDTIICNVKEPLSYKFMYNTCCDSFDVLDANGKRILGKVDFRLEGSEGEKKFLGTMDGDAILLASNKTEKQNSTILIMNLDNLKPAWRQFRVVSSMQQMDQSELLMILESAEGMTTSRMNRFVVHTLSFLLIIICCQGG